ncbi:hypothetical protein FE634_20695 [Nocardioides dongxiaopingii]|jgi:hypothetical protein|uniref:hypothetical protein n=1 Tax=Nocardioides sp. S-1144 TaxID=2582905 RepID=UPI00110E0A58|nr:hypothetical protein [Nocardioides sp. S-1144]QCW52240.1 hypothetical protein FE634_20695 [Nocardioides sp. S-1144]
MAEENQTPPGIFVLGEEDTAAEETDTGALLDEVVVADADTRLLAVLDRVRGTVERIRADDAAEVAAAGGLDPELVGLLVAESSAEDASFEIRSIGDRVERGTLTWESFWARPQADPGGLELAARVQRRQAEALVADRAAFDEAEAAERP